MYHEHEARAWAPSVVWRDKVAHVDVELVLGAVVLMGLALWSADAAAVPLVDVRFDLGPVLVLLAAAATLPRARLGVGRGLRTVTFDATGAVLLLAAVLLRPEWIPVVALAASLRSERWRTVLNTCVRTIAVASAAIVFHAYVALFATVHVGFDVQRVVELVLAGVTLAVVEAVLFRRHLRAVDQLGGDVPGLVRVAMLRDAPAIALGCVSVVLLTAVGPATVLLVVPLAALVATSLRDQERLLESTRDHKTNLLTFQGFRPQAAAEIARARRHDRPLVMLVMDLDGLKSVNTALGFLAGESVIRTLGRVLRETMREEDLVSRIGGDEFGLLLPDTDLEGGLAFAERLRHAVATTPLMDGGRPPLHRTASIGLATLSTHDTLETLLDRADRGLRLAKEQGRDRVVVMGPQAAVRGTDVDGSACG
jgi:diguanylate cyclase (GGDEF)-like protein